MIEIDGNGGVVVARVERMASKKGSTEGLRKWHLSRREAKREGAGVEGRRDGGDDGGDRGVRSGSKGLKGERNYISRGQPAPCEAKGA